MAKATFPQIDYDFWFNNYSWEGFSSMKNMITTMKNKNYIDEIINQENITDNIKTKIELYIEKANDDNLFEIFKLIQTWGGKSVGNYTLDIVKNWNSPLFVSEANNSTYSNYYKIFVDKILNNNEIESFGFLLNERKIKGLSYSFIPKHICFWSGKGDRTQGFPILDDIIAKIVYKVDSAKDVDYKQFIDDIKSQSNILNTERSEAEKLSLSQIEMALFSFAGNYWSTGNTGTKEFKLKPKFENDIKHANLIAETFIPKLFKSKGIRNSTSQQNQYSIAKEDYRKNTNGIIFISKNYSSKNKNIEKLLKKNSSINLNGIEYFEYIGDIANLTIT
jgi:hypothetical protein